MPKFIQPSKKLLYSRKERHAPLPEDLLPSLKQKHARKRKRENSDNPREDSHISDLEEACIVDKASFSKILKLANESLSFLEFDNESEPETVISDSIVSETEEDCADLLTGNEESSDILSQNHQEPDNKQEFKKLADVILLELEKKKKEDTDEIKSIIEDKRVLELYTSIGKYLSKYTSGKIPKAFKIIPRLVHWEQILVLTDPIQWTPQSMRAAVRIFVSNLKPQPAQRFYNLVLLPAVREDIQNNKKLNYNYYQALKRAMFKPAAWFQGLLFPLLTEGCSWREAAIIKSILSRVSIPPLHVSAVLVQLSQLHKDNPANWTSATSYMINVLLNKKSTLTRSVLKALFDYFYAFTTAPYQLHCPFSVIWHQTLLTFVQCYKRDFTPEILSGIRKLVSMHTHHLIGPEIQRELQYADKNSILM